MLEHRHCGRNNLRMTEGNQIESFFQPVRDSLHMLTDLPSCISPIFMNQTNDVMYGSIYSCLHRIITML